MNHQEAKRMLAMLEDEPMSEDEARAIMAQAEAAGIAADPAWVQGPGPMPCNGYDDDGSVVLLMI